MISFEQALKLIKQHQPPLKMEMRRIENSLGYVLAENIYAAVNLPIDDNSAMDGFVLRAKDTQKARNYPISLKIQGVIQAGDTKKRSLKASQVFRIMTGAFIPRGGDTVLPKELAVIKNNHLIVSRELARGKHIRYRGEEVKKGSLVLKKHTPIHPATIGILATLGKAQVRVYQKPRATLITTGSELIRPGKKLKQGQIYDSNSFMMESALGNMGLMPFKVCRVKDNPKQLKKTIQQIFPKSDVVILMGGVSVGDYDCVKDILKEYGVKRVFWRVRQKPGKPIYFGKKGKTLVFGLPGNPASVFTCFYQFVFPSLRQCMGYKGPNLTQAIARVDTEIKPDQNKTIFLKARTRMDAKGRTVTPLFRQASHMISSLQDADGFIRVPPRKQKIKKGQCVQVDLLPGLSHEN